MSQGFQIKRRQILGLFCTAAALSQVPLAVAASKATSGIEFLEWRGIALGADAQLKIYHDDKIDARRLLEMVLQEVERQEMLFSLYREDSVLSRLNRDGEVSGFAGDFYYLMSLVDEHVKLTQGVFDPTVQVLWQSYRDFIMEYPEATPEMLTAEIEKARGLLGWEGIELTPERIRLAKAGQSITLNGIAQGFITDRVTDLLKQQGIDHALINMGEIRGVVPPGKEAWTVGISDPENEQELLQTLNLANQAMATSSSIGSYLSYEKKIGHIFNPATLQSDDRYLSVTVVAKTATQADALATAFSVMPIELIKDVLGQLTDVAVYVLDNKRQWYELS
ncbi:FAD:protein FMN transferase [Oligella ureolytica]